jgi:hypothetical protein
VNRYKWPVVGVLREWKIDTLMSLLQNTGGF